MSRLRAKTSSPTRMPLYTRGKIAAKEKEKEKEERKENAFAGGMCSPSLGGAVRSGHDVLALNAKAARKPEPAAAPPRRFLAESEPKPKSLAAKRRNVLAIRKPNASKTQIGGVVKAKASRRSADDSENPRPSHSGKLSKRSFARSSRVSSRAGLRASTNRCRAMASSSSDERAANWEDVAGAAPLAARSPAPAKRRPLHAPASALLKKIRLKPGL